jgi:uncharacterized protein with HEPN domain
MSGNQLYYIQHIVDAGRRIETYLAGVEHDAFLRSDLLKAAVVRELEVIGEAAKNVDEAFRLRNPDVPWKRMAGMRDKLIHHYFAVDYEAVWDTATRDIPTLRPGIERMLPKIEGDCR